MLISPSRDVVVSLSRDLYYKSVRLGGFKSVENYYLNGGVTPRIFVGIFSYLKYERKRVHFLLYIDKHMVHEREKCTPLRSYISRAVNVGAELNVYWNVS